MYTIWYQVQKTDGGYQIMRFTEIEEAEDEVNGKQKPSPSSSMSDGLFAVGPQRVMRMGDSSPRPLLVAPVEEESLFAVKAEAVKRANELNKEQGERQGRVITVNLHCQEENKPQVREACQRAINDLELITFAGFKKRPSGALRTASGHQMASLSFWVQVDTSVELARIEEFQDLVLDAMMNLDGVDGCNAIPSGAITYEASEDN